MASLHCTQEVPTSNDWFCALHDLGDEERLVGIPLMSSAWRFLLSWLLRLLQVPLDGGLKKLRGRLAVKEALEEETTLKSILSGFGLNYCPGKGCVSIDFMHGPGTG